MLTILRPYLHISTLQFFWLFEKIVSDSGPVMSNYSRILCDTVEKWDIHLFQWHTSILLTHIQKLPAVTWGYCNVHWPQACFSLYCGACTKGLRNSPPLYCLYKNNISLLLLLLIGTISWKLFIVSKDLLDVWFQIYFSFQVSSPCLISSDVAPQ